MERSPFHLFHGRASKPRPVNCVGVSDNLFQARLTRYCRDLVRAAICRPHLQGQRRARSNALDVDAGLRASRAAR